MQEGQIYLKQNEERLAELVADLESAEAEFETYVSGNEYAGEHGLKPVATKEEIELTQQIIQEIKDSITNLEILQTKIISVVDKLEATEEKLLKTIRRLTNIRKNYAHQTTSEIISRKPRFIVMEDLNVSGMMRNRHLSKAIQNQSFYEFKRQIAYKCEWNNIKFIQADRFYPSSKLCSECGCINQSLKLSDRIFICPECGNEIDRDYQASINLRNYGSRIA